MKKNYLFTLVLTIIISSITFGQDLIITGAYDAGLTGGTPKGVELFVINDIADLSIYGLGSANNGGGTDGEEFEFPNVTATKGSFIYVATEALNFKAFFGFDPDYVDGSVGINGDDAVELFMNDAVIDVFGDINKDGTGESWDFVDGWAYRKSGSTINTTFTDTDWIYSGINVFDGEATNSGSSNPFPLGTYTEVASTTPEITAIGDDESFDYFEGFGPSAEQEFTIEGVNLTDDITLTAPTNFEVSLTSGSGFANSLIITQTDGSASANIYVRLAAGLSANTYSGVITVSSAGAEDLTGNFEGVVSPANAQFSFTAFLNDFNYVVSVGGPSPEQTFSVQGLFLTDDIVITAPADYEVSLTSDAGFAGSVSVSSGAGTVAETTVYVRLKAGLASGSYTGDITISSTGVTDKTISINGNAFGDATNSMVISGIFDGTLSGGNPKGVEIFILKDIADLSLFGISSVGNGGGSTAGNVEFTFTGSAAAGDYLYVASSTSDFNTFFGFNPTFETGTMNMNGDDAIELYENGQIIDVYGDVNNDFSGETYDYVDGWAYRKGNTGPEGTTFTPGNWNYSGVDGLEGGTDNGSATKPFPIGTFDTPASVKNNTIEGFATYPNPVTNNTFTITTNSTDKKEVKIFNVLGKQVFATTFSDTKSTLTIPAISAGLYILKVTEGTKTATSKLVIK